MMVETPQPVSGEWSASRRAGRGGRERTLVASLKSLAHDVDVSGAVAERREGRKGGGGKKGVKLAPIV
jgi:hypothetical protein